MHTKDLKTNYAPAAMVNWQEAGRTWPRPHPHAAHLLRGLVWDQHYRHSHPQCEGGMPRSFELRTDMAPDRLQAVEDWLRAEGFAFRFQRRRWRTWTRPDRPGEGLRPDGIEEDEDSNAYPSGATMKVLPWVDVCAGGLGAGKTGGAGTRGVSLDVVIGGRTGYSNTNGGESSDNRSKVHADCYPAENPSL